MIFIIYSIKEERGVHKRVWNDYQLWHRAKPHLNGTQSHQIKEGILCKIHLQLKKVICSQTLILRVLMMASDTFLTAIGK